MSLFLVNEFFSLQIMYHNKTAKVINIEIVSIRSSNENSLIKRHISTIYGLIIDPRNIQLSVGPIAQLIKHYTSS